MKVSSMTNKKVFESPHQQAMCTPPNPPTPEMVEKAQFIDKTYIWKHAGIRPGDKRSS